MRKDIAGATVRAFASWTMAGMLAIAGTALLVPAQTEAATLGAGLSHSCALADGGRVKCWGANGYRQLGDGTTTDRLTPVDATALSEPVTAIAVGGNHTCGLNAAGGVRCWGLNQFGQLGDGTSTETPLAVEVVGLPSGVVALAGGRRHSCALTSAGAVRCWGSNEKGQLGNDSTTDSPLPVDVAGLQSGVTAIAAGGYNTCAVTSAGAVKCWGDNTYGQLGNGTTDEAHVPVDVVGLSSGMTEVSIAELHGCARSSGGDLKCWGTGYLGDGTQSDSLVPVDVQPLGSAAIGVAVGYDHACALSDTGFVKCWGYNDSGDIGDGSYVDRLVPTPVQGLDSGVVEIATSNLHTCARLQSGELRCWGWSDRAQIGDGVPSRRDLPVDVAGLEEGASALAPGLFHTCALTTGGAVECWGGNLHGTLGDSTVIPHLTPAVVGGLSEGVTRIASGSEQTCALTADGAVSCWGQTDQGIVPFPVGVVGLTSGVQAIALGSRHACAVTDAAAAKCWGQNGSGQLGDGTNTYRANPVDVSGLASGVATLAGGYQHTCAITTLGSVKCWGANGTGQLGDGTTTSRSVPVDVVGLDAVAVAIAASSAGTCVVTSTGTVKCWGGAALVLVPSEMPGLSDVTGISAGSLHFCASNAGGALKCWGGNEYGQLGDGTFVDHDAPMDVIGLTAGVTGVYAGENTTCATTAAGATKCWGSNVLGQLGNGEAGYAIVPRTVVGSPFADLVFRNGFD